MIGLIEIIPITSLIIFFYFLAKPPAWLEKVQKNKFERDNGGLIDGYGLEHAASVGRKIESVATIIVDSSRYKILGSNELNASVDSSGSVYITLGMLNLVRDDENALAAVLAHELAHFSAGHSGDRRREGVKYELLRRLLSVGGWVMGTIGTQISKVGMAQYSQAQELEADRIAISYLSLAGYDPFAMSRLLIRLNEIFKSQDHDSSPLTQLLSSHPEAEKRIAAAITVAQLRQ
jgi:predicted Zn-dependent protease